jgi:hypothetical protein
LKDGGAKNAVLSEKVKLSKFKCFFDTHPLIESRVRSGLAYYYAVNGNYLNSLNNYIKAIYLAPLEAKVYKDMAKGIFSLITYSK